MMIGRKGMVGPLRELPLHFDRLLLKVGITLPRWNGGTLVLKFAFKYRSKSQFCLPDGWIDL